MFRSFGVLMANLRDLEIDMHPDAKQLLGDLVTLSGLGHVAGKPRLNSESNLLLQLKTLEILVYKKVAIL